MAGLLTNLCCGGGRIKEPYEKPLKRLLSASVLDLSAVEAFALEAQSDGSGATVALRWFWNEVDRLEPLSHSFRNGLEAFDLCSAALLAAHAASRSQVPIAEAEALAKALLVKAEALAKSAISQRTEYLQKVLSQSLAIWGDLVPENSKRAKGLKPRILVHVRARGLEMGAPEMDLKPGDLLEPKMPSAEWREIWQQRGDKQNRAMALRGFFADGQLDDVCLLAFREGGFDFDAFLEVLVETLGYDFVKMGQAVLSVVETSVRRLGKLGKGPPHKLPQNMLRTLTEEMVRGSLEALRDQQFKLLGASSAILQLVSFLAAAGKVPADDSDSDDSRSPQRPPKPAVQSDTLTALEGYAWEMVLAAIFGAIPATPAKTRAAHAGYIFEVLRPALGAISDLSLSSQLMNHDQLSILATCGRSHTDQARECLREFANRLDEQEAQQILRLRHYGFALRQAARDFQLLGVEAPDLGRTCTDLEVRSQSQAASGPAGAADGDRDEGPEVENPDAGARAESAAPQIDSADEAKLRAIFKTCDTNGDGTINKRELIKMCRQSFETAMFFGLPSVIKQEDGSRAKLEERFQRMDQNDDREVTWEEFHHWYMSEMAAAPKPSAAPTARSSADSAEMAPRASLSLTEELDSETELSPRPEPRAGAKPAIASGVVKALTDMVEASEVSETGLQVEDQPVSQERVENAMRFLDFVYEQVAANTHDGQVTRRDLEDLILASDSYGQCFECLGTVPGNDLTTSDIDIGTVEFTDHFLDEVACEHLEGLRLLTVPPEPWNPVPARRLEVAASMALEPPEASAKDTPVLAITDPTPEPADYALALAFSTGLKPTQQEAVDDQLEEQCEQTQVSTALAVLDEPVSSTLPAQEEVVSEMAPAQPVLPITEVQVPVQAVPDNWFADAVSPVAERPALPPVPMRELEDASGGLPTIPSGRGVGLPDSSDLALPDPTPKLDLGSSLLSTAADTWAPTLEESQSLSMAKTTESASGQRPVQAFASAQSATFFGQVPTETFQMQTVEVQAQPAPSAQVGLAKSSVLQLTEAPNSQRSLRFEEAQEAQQSPSSQNARRQGSDDERPSTWRTDPTRSSDASCPQSQEPSNTRAPTGAGAVPPLPLGCLNGESARPSQEPFRMDMGQAAYSANQASGQFASFEEHMRTSAGPFPRWGPESYRMGQIQRDDFAYESSLPGFPFPYDDSLPDALQEQIQAFYHELQETKARQRRAERDNDELVGYLAALLGEPDHANTRSDARTPLGSSRAEDVVRQTLPMPPAPAELQTVEQPPPPPPPPSQPFQDLLSKPMVNISFGAGPSQAVESRPQRTSEHVLTESVASILPLAFRNLLERPQLDRGEQLQQQMLQQMQQQQQQMQQLQQQQLQLQMHLSQAQAKTSTPRPASQPSQRSILDQLRAELAAEKRQAAPAPISPEVTALQDMLKELRDAGQATIGQLLDALQDVRTTQQRLERQALIPALPAPAYIGEDSMQSHGLHSSMSQPVIPKSYQSYQDTSAVSQPRIKAFETDIPRSPVKGLFVPRSEDGRRAWAPAPARPLIPRRRPQGQPSQCSAPRGPQRALFDQEMARWDARAQQLEAQFRRLHGPAAQ